MPPKFSLQSVLDYRHSRVEVLEVELGQLFATQQQYEEYLQSLHSMEIQLWDKLNAHQIGEVDLVSIAQCRSQLETIDVQKAQFRTAIAAIKEQVAAKRQEVINARQDEEMLVILKDKEVERYEAQLLQDELRLQDDIYIAQAHHAQTP